MSSPAGSGRRNRRLKRPHVELDAVDEDELEVFEEDDQPSAHEEAAAKKKTTKKSAKKNGGSEEDPE